VHRKYVGGLRCQAVCRGGRGEGRRGLMCEAVQRLLHAGFVAVLEEQLADEICVDADGAVRFGHLAPPGRVADARACTTINVRNGVLLGPEDVTAARSRPMRDRMGAGCRQRAGT
jgi:hypothetical protein